MRRLRFVADALNGASLVLIVLAVWSSLPVPAKAQPVPGGTNCADVSCAICNTFQSCGGFCRNIDCGTSCASGNQCPGCFCNLTAGGCVCQ